MRPARHGLRPLERFVVKDKKRIFFVPVSHVLWIEATGTMHAHTPPATVTCCGNPGTTAQLEEKPRVHQPIKTAPLVDDNLDPIRLRVETAVT